MKLPAALLLAAALLSGPTALAAGRKKPAPKGATNTSTAKKKGEGDKTPSPHDPSQNDGAQGRKNATVDEAAAGESPLNQRRP